MSRSVPVATPIDRERIEATYAVIAPHVRVTPLLQVNGADFGLSPFSGGNTTAVDFGAGTPSTPARLKPRARSSVG